MLRSLNSGVTGLMNHQVRMDVIGNNIANVNTIGYKGRRTTFEESFNQLIKGASRSESKAGGTNPMQVGLGVAVGSVDVVFGQGNLQNTGRIFDLAIEGNAFFGVSDGTGTFYTRNGAFQLDSEGYIILPTNGMVLQGRMADTFGNFPPGTAIGNLQIPLNQQAPAKETTEIAMGRNLNSEADAKGSISYTQQLLHAADTARAPGDHGANDTGRTQTPLSSLFDSQGKSLGIKEGDILTISWYNESTIVPGTNPTSEIGIKISRDADPDDPANTIGATFNPANGIAWNLEQFMECMQYALNNNINPNGTVTANTNNVTVALADGATIVPGTGVAGPPAIPAVIPPAGSMYIAQAGTGLAAQIFNFQVKSSNPLSDSETSWAFNFDGHIGDATGNYPEKKYQVSDILLRPAEQFDYIENLRDTHGQPLTPGLENGDQIDVFGSVGKHSIENGKSRPLKFFDSNYAGTDPDYIGMPTMLDDLIAKIRNDFKLPAEYVDRDGVHLQSVSMNPAGTDDGIPAGSLVLRGAKGTDFSLNNLSIRATNSNSNTIAPTYFNAAMGITEKRKAEDVGVVDFPISVYDESGAEHVLTMTFVHTGKAGEWEWKASFAGKEEIMPGSGTGKVHFGQDGTISAWIFDDGGSQLIADPRNGSNMMRINLNVGGPGDFKGITQFAAASSVQAISQDGYPTGNLIEVSIDEFGLIEGAFSNGTSRSIAQIMMIDFANPGGLLDLSESIYTTSANSGDPVWGLPVKQSSSKLKPGALEMSNVDLAGEFTNMITTQRGYQANSRIITVSDTMLEELVNLKR